MDKKEEKSVALFDPNKLKEDLQARVRAQFIEVIPDEQWDALIEAEIKAFFEEKSYLLVEEEERKETNRYGNTTGHKSTFDRLKVKGTAFRALVYEALIVIVKEKLDKALEQDQFQIRTMNVFKEFVDDQGYNQRQQVTEVDYLGVFMQRQLEKLVPDMVTQMFRGIFSNAAESVKESIRRSNPNMF